MAVQDHYENIYAVICGVKVFSLLPPADAYRLGITPYPVAQYARDQLGRLQLDLVQPKQVEPHHMCTWNYLRLSFLESQHVRS